MSKMRVMFVCLGNSCRSQMAEGFARAYGSQVMDVVSSGLAPATGVAAMTIQTMREHNIDVSGHVPKSIYEVRGPVDLIVNMSGFPMPRDIVGNIREWKVQDPIGLNAEVYRNVAGIIERLVMQLILELRQASPARQAPAPPAPRQGGLAEPRKRRHRLGDPRPPGH
jgi:arsenate reductase